MTTKEIDFTHAEILIPALTSIEIEVKYKATAFFVFDSAGGEVGVSISFLFVSVNGQPFTSENVPEETEGSDARKFLALMREAARKALWLSENPKEERSFAQMFGRKDDENES